MVSMKRSREQAEAKPGKRMQRLSWWRSSKVRPSGSAGSIHLRPQKSQLPASLHRSKFDQNKVRSYDQTLYAIISLRCIDREVVFNKVKTYHSYRALF
jgi:hypothetical protein